MQRAHPPSVFANLYPPASWIASVPLSPVRIRMISCTGETKILPSPMTPVRAAATIVPVTSCTWSSLTTATIPTLGRSIVYSCPRHCCVMPFWMPCALSLR